MIRFFIWVPVLSVLLASGAWASLMPAAPVMGPVPGCAGSMPRPASPADSSLEQGLAAADAGRHEDAIGHFTRAIALDPNLEEAYYERAGSYDALGQYQMAAHDLEKAISLNPNDACAHNNLGVEQETLGLPDQAMASYTRAIAIAPTLSNPWENRAYVKYDRGDLAGARADAQQALALDPTIPFEPEIAALLK